MKKFSRVNFLLIFSVFLLISSACFGSVEPKDWNAFRASGFAAEFSYKAWGDKVTTKGEGIYFTPDTPRIIWWGHVKQSQLGLYALGRKPKFKIRWIDAAGQTFFLDDYAERAMKGYYVKSELDLSALKEKIVLGKCYVELLYKNEIVYRRLFFLGSESEIQARGKGDQSDDFLEVYSSDEDIWEQIKDSGVSETIKRRHFYWMKASSRTGLVNVVLDDTEYANWWALLKPMSFRLLVTPTLKVKWYAPSGDLYQETNVRAEFDDEYVVAPFAVKGERSAGLHGVWRVEVYLGNRLVDVTPFLIIPREYEKDVKWGGVIREIKKTEEEDARLKKEEEKKAVETAAATSYMKKGQNEIKFSKKLTVSDILESPAVLSKISDKHEVRIVLERILDGELRVNRIAYRLMRDIKAAEKDAGNDVFPFYLIKVNANLQELYDLPVSDGWMVVGPLQDDLSVMLPKYGVIRNIQKNEGNRPEQQGVNYEFEHVLAAGNETLEVPGLHLPFGCRFYVNHVDDDINAGTDGKSTIVVNAGMMNALVTDDQLAFVLGHEIGHIQADHLKSLKRRNVAKFVVKWGFVALSIYAGQSGGSTYGYIHQNGHDVLAGEMLGQLVTAPFSKEKEYEADELSLEYLHKSGFSLKEGVRFFEILKERKKSSNYYSFTHPPSSKRIERVKNFIRETGPASDA